MSTFLIPLSEYVPVNTLGFLFVVVGIMVVVFDVYMQPGINTNDDRQVMTMLNPVETT